MKNKTFIYCISFFFIVFSSRAEWRTINVNGEIIPFSKIAKINKISVFIVGVPSCNMCIILKEHLKNDRKIDLSKVDLYEVNLCSKIKESTFMDSESYRLWRQIEKLDAFPYIYILNPATNLVARGSLDGMQIKKWIDQLTSDYSAFTRSIWSENGDVSISGEVAMNGNTARNGSKTKTKSENTIKPPSIKPPLADSNKTSDEADTVNMVEDIDNENTSVIKNKISFEYKNGKSLRVTFSNEPKENIMVRMVNPYIITIKLDNANEIDKKIFNKCLLKLGKDKVPLSIIIQPGTDNKIIQITVTDKTKRFGQLVPVTCSDNNLNCFVDLILSSQ